MSERIVTKNCYIATMGSSARKYEFGHIVVEDGNLLTAEVCKAAEDLKRASAKGAKV